MRQFLPRLLGCASILLLAACAAPSGWPPAQPAQPLPAQDRALLELLGYYQALGNRSLDALESERRFQQASLIADRCSQSRMRLGLVLLRLQEAGDLNEHDEEVMYPCLHDSGDGSGVHLLAQLVHQQLQAHARSRMLQRDTSRTLEALMKDNQELRRQVDGLKAIERSLQNRHRE